MLFLTLLPIFAVILIQLIFSVIKLKYKALMKLKNELNNNINVANAKNEKARKSIEIKIYNGLQKYCDDNKINIFIRDEEFMGESAGLINYWVNSNQELLEHRSKKIYLLDRYVSPWVLAHEIGHYIGKKFYNDTSEERADHEGRLLVESFLCKDDFEKITWVLDIYLPKNYELNSHAS